MQIQQLLIYGGHFCFVLIDSYLKFAEFMYELQELLRPDAPNYGFRAERERDWRNRLVLKSSQPGEVKSK